VGPDEGGGDGGPEEGQGEDDHGSNQVDEVIHAQGHHQAKEYLIISTIYGRKSPVKSVIFLGRKTPNC
jgi:hypothetical protein